MKNDMEFDSNLLLIQNYLNYSFWKYVFLLVSRSISFFLSLSLLYRINGIRVVFFFFFLEIFHRFLLQKKRDWYERFNSGGKKKSELFNIFGYFIVESIFIRREN